MLLRHHWVCFKTANQAESDLQRVSDKFHGDGQQVVFSSVGWWNITTQRQNRNCGDDVGGINAKHNYGL